MGPAAEAAADFSSWREDGAAPRRRMTRRAFLARICGATLATGGACGATAAYARYVEPYWPVLEQRTLDLPNLAAGLVGRRVLHLSDLHLSPVTPYDFLRRQIEYCATLAPDLVLLTGDYSTMGTAAHLGQLTELLRALRAPAGIFAVLGNHDWCVYSPGRAPAPVRPSNATERALQAAGVRVLVNERATVTWDGGGLQIVGLEDLWSGYCDAERAFAGVDPATPCVALAHNPDTIDALRGRRWDWLLCGHTHGGQVRIPLYGAPLLPVRNTQYDAGLFTVGAQRLYVNRGLGSLRQVRFNCRPEIALFTLAARSGACLVKAGGICEDPHSPPGGAAQGAA